MSVVDAVDGPSTGTRDVGAVFSREICAVHESPLGTKLT